MEAGPGATAQIGDTRLPIVMSQQSINLFAGTLGFGFFVVPSRGVQGRCDAGAWELGSQFDRVCTFITAGLGFLY